VGIIDNVSVQHFYSPIGIYRIVGYRRREEKCPSRRASRR
jgi:hypothetical protein